MTQCTKCDSALEPEAEESPRSDQHGNIVCDRCYDDYYRHLCPICEEFFYEDINKEISPKYIIITKDAEENHIAKAGLYKILKLPFYADGMIEITLFKDAIKRLSDVPQDFDESDLHYPIHFVCESCAKKILKKCIICGELIDKDLYYCPYCGEFNSCCGLTLKDIFESEYGGPIIDQSPKNNPDQSKILFVHCFGMFNKQNEECAYCNIAVECYESTNTSCHPRAT